MVPSGGRGYFAREKLLVHVLKVLKAFSSVSTDESLLSIATNVSNEAIIPHTTPTCSIRDFQGYFACPLLTTLHSSLCSRS